MKTKILIAISILVISYTGYRVWSSPLLASIKEQTTGVRVMNYKTGYKYRMEIGREFEGWPVQCPDTKTMDCFTAEQCFWKECGKKQGGTWVVLNETRGLDDPTNCPVCGHEVYGRNPLPHGTFVDLQGNLHHRDKAQQAP